MNLRFLETFIWVARLNSFSATADRLHTTQAAVSNRIAALERELGVRLFDRDLRSVRLTPEGRAALSRAEDIVRLTQEFQGAISSKDALRGRLAMGAIDSVVHSWLPRLIRRIQQTYPCVELDLTVDTSLTIAGQFHRSELDLAIMMGPVIAPQVESRFLGSLPCSWYAAPDMDLPAEPLPIASLAAWPILAFSRGSKPHQDILRHFADAGVKATALSNFNSIATMMILAEDSLGVTMLPDAAAQGAITAGRLRRLAVTPPPPPIDVHAAYTTQPRNTIATTVASMAQAEAEAFGRRGRDEEGDAG
ncbi:LysR family transcriptional regulator [Falsiroseomonas selenitidurans]|uniref:LysR family transcriptional regulator n=1 Tax=Falsiroseomonas selenitidurans TaxID=2716335 RepID=A0ABX1EBF2_9PROT|nr:LysR family transcriptional regulator [Falsiroseomonas selenitidurans]NKC34140.1 LysR family transcriptional regulator [Falsiroseomonas selenitidurans]